jgi:hypothetical protein
MINENKETKMINEKAVFLMEIYGMVIGKNEELKIDTEEGLRESLIRVKIFNELHAKFGDGLE